MKKTLSRVLSLTLVLVMVLGMMPMVSADVLTHNHVLSQATCTTPATCTLEGCTYTQGEVDPQAHTVTEWNYPSNFDCTVGGSKSGYCDLCHHLIEETVPAGSHNYGDVTVTTQPTCKLPGVGTKTCSVCGHVDEAVEIPADETKHVYDPTTGLCTNKDANGNVCGAENPDKPEYTVAISKEALTLDVAESAALTVTVFSGTTPVTEDYTVAWGTDNAAVATVDGGKVTGVAKGTAKITATVTIGDEEHVEECVVTVSNGAITCANYSAVASSGYNTHQLAPVYGDETPNGVYFTYDLSSNNYSSATASVSAAGLVSLRGAGLVSVTVTARTATEVLATEEVLVSFFTDDDVEVTMKDGVTSFAFGSTTALENSKVLSKLILANVGVTPGSLTDAFMQVKLSTLGDTLSGATLTLPENTGADKLSMTVPAMYLDDVVLKLNNNSKTTFVFGYTFYYGDVTYGTGTVTIHLADRTGDIVYKTTSGQAVSFDEDDFEAFYNQTYKTTSLNYVYFDVSSKVPVYGDLYTSTSKTTAVKSTMAFKPNYTTSSTAYDLDAVTYVPQNNLNVDYEVEIPFTCYGGTNNKNTVSGVVVIEVTNGNMPFTDVDEDDWYYEDVLYVYSNGIMNGTSTYLFSPNNTLTRAMVVTMLYRIEGEPTNFKSSSFKDLTQDWYEDAVEWAAYNDIVNGYSSTQFGPNNAITREQLAAILYRYAGYKKMSTYSNASLTKFSDYKSVSSYATEAMEWAVYQGIITGSDGKLMPGGSATRAQAAAMFHRFLEN